MKHHLPAVLLLAAGCMSTVQTMREGKPTPPPGPDEAKVVVYRSSAFGGIDHFPIYEYMNGDGKLMGVTETDCYFEYRCPPGKHFFLTWGEGDAFIEATLDAGKTYYIQAWSKFGIISSRPGFGPVGKDSEAMKELRAAWPRLRCREIDPADVTYVETRDEARLQKAREAYEAGSKSAKFLRPEDGLPEPLGR